MKKYMVSILVVALVVSNAAQAGLGADIDNFVHRHKTAIKVGVAAAGVAGAIALLVKNDWQSMADALCKERETKMADLVQWCVDQGEDKALAESVIREYLKSGVQIAVLEKLAVFKELVLTKGVQAHEMLNLTEVSQNFSQAAVLAGESLNKAGAGFERFVMGAMRGGEEVGAKVGACMGAVLAGEIAALAPVVAAHAVILGAIKASRKALGLRA